MRSIGLLVLASGLVASARAAAPTHFVLAADGNEARYKVREQLANLNFPTDAVGTTSAITGSLVFGPGGKIDSAASKFSVDLRTLKSDRDRRDHYIQARTLMTGSFPNAVLVPTAVKGLKWPLPTSGPTTFELDGLFTVHGVTKPTAWNVTMDGEDGGYTGVASTAFTFADFGMTQPRLMILLSVADTIRLEYSFHLVPDTSSR